MRTMRVQERYRTPRSSARHVADFDCLPFDGEAASRYGTLIDHAALLPSCVVWH